MSRYIEIVDSYVLEEPMPHGDRLVAMSDIFISLKKEGFCTSDYTDDFVDYLLNKMNVSKNPAYTTYVLMYMKYYKNIIINDKAVVEESADEQIPVDISMFTKKTLDKEFCERLGIIDEE